MADAFSPQLTTLRMTEAKSAAPSTQPLSPPSPMPLSPEPQTNDRNDGGSPPPLVDALFASALLNRDADPSHIDHYNTVVSAQALLHDLTTSNALDPGKKPPRTSRTGEAVDGPVPKLILQPTTVDDKERQVERFQMVRGGRCCRLWLAPPHYSPNSLAPRFPTLPHPPHPTSLKSWWRTG